MFNEEKIVNLMAKFNQLSFIRILQRTMIILFPLALVGSIAWIININLLASGGFLYNVLHVQLWLPFRGPFLMMPRLLQLVGFHRMQP